MKLDLEKYKQKESVNMNGLEAIELMKQGKIVKLYNTDIKFKIENERVVNVNPDVCSRNFIVNGKYEVAKEPKQLTGWERVDDGDNFNTIFSNGILLATEMNYITDIERYESANYFSTKEKAEEINFKQTLFRKLQRFSDENGGNKIDWEDRTQKKFFIQYEPSYDFYVDYYYFDKEFGQVYFASEDIAEKTIELFYDDLIKYFTHDWNKSL